MKLSPQYITKNEENEDKNESTDIVIPGISKFTYPCSKEKGKSNIFHVQ